MRRLDGKVAIVTGGASGIGAATVRRFSAEGACVVCADVDEAGGAAVVESVRATGGDVFFHRTDVGDRADCDAVVAAAVERFGGLDVFHANAAWSGGGYVSELDPEVWDASLRVMLTGVFLGVRAALPAMLARGGGSIVVTASIEAFVAEILAAPYNASKAALINLARTVAVEYGRRRIRANCICPGVVDTPLLARLLEVSPNGRADIAEATALGRLIDPDEIARVALFLASDESSAITGAALVVDAGMTCRSPISGFPPYGG